MIGHCCNRPAAGARASHSACSFCAACDRDCCSVRCCHTDAQAILRRDSASDLGRRCHRRLCCPCSASSCQRGMCPWSR